MAVDDHFDGYWSGRGTKYERYNVHSETLETCYDGDTDFGDRQEAPVCRTCGAYVHDPVKHAEFHDALKVVGTTLIARVDEQGTEAVRLEHRVTALSRVIERLDG